MVLKCQEGAGITLNRSEHKHVVPSSSPASLLVGDQERLGVIYPFCY